MEKHVLVKKMFYKLAKHELATISLSQKDSPWNGNTLSSGKGKDQGAAVSKEDQADSLLGN